MNRQFVFLLYQLESGAIPADKWQETFDTLARNEGKITKHEESELLESLLIGMCKNHPSVHDRFPPSHTTSTN